MTHDSAARNRRTARSVWPSMLAQPAVYRVALTSSIGSWWLRASVAAASAAAALATKSPASRSQIDRASNDSALSVARLPDWWGGSRDPLVYVSFGSVAGSVASAVPIYRVALDAVAGLPIRVLLTVGREVDIGGLGTVPTNTHVAPWVAQGDVVAAANLVVCHGGSGTTFGAIAAGVPLVITPMFADQPANGRRIEAAGAGLVVRTRVNEHVHDWRDERIGTLEDGDAPRLRAAIETVLADRSYRHAAARIAAEMHASPTIDGTVARLAAAVTGGGGVRG